MSDLPGIPDDPQRTPARQALLDALCALYTDEELKLTLLAHGDVFSVVLLHHVMHGLIHQLAGEASTRALPEATPEYTRKSMDAWFSTGDPVWQCFRPMAEAQLARTDLTPLDRTDLLNVKLAMLAPFAMIHLFRTVRSKPK